MFNLKTIAMKKFRCLLMMLAVAVVALSCEKEPIAPDVDPVNPEDSIVQPGMEDEVAQFLGLWTRSVNYEESHHLYATHSNWEWRFYEDGRSLRWIGDYKGDVLSGVSSGPILYRVENGKLYTRHYHGDSDWKEWDYRFEGDNLTLSYESEGESSVMTLVKTEDADDKLVGDWSAIVRNGANGELIELHYKFHTPTYGSIYEVTYNAAGTKSLGEKMLGTFRYRFDASSISMYDGCSYNFTYRLVGTKLYLRSGGGEEIMYSNFDAEHGIPFEP